MASTTPSATFSDKPFQVHSPNVTYTEEEIVSKYTYEVREMTTTTTLLSLCPSACVRAFVVLAGAGGGSVSTPLVRRPPA